MKSIAVLLTCYNRVTQTTKCLESLFSAKQIENVILTIFLLDDKSPDKTGEIISKKFPSVNVIIGDGNLFWAGGMRTVWEYAKSKDDYDGYLLLNDDVILLKSFLKDLLFTHKYCIEKYKIDGIYVSTTHDFISNKISYGGRYIKKLLFKYKTALIVPDKLPQECTLANANILLIMKSVVEKIGIFNEKFTHGIADYDYTLTAKKNGIPLLVAPNVGGYCTDDHGNNWLDSNSTLKDRVKFLYSPKGLAYKEYLYYLRRHFPRYIPYYFIMLWSKTFFPKIWDKFK